MWDPYAEFQKATLFNGLTVYATQWPKRPWEAIGFLVHSGARNDPVGLEGIAHFVEHLIAENTNIFIDEIKAFFLDCGGEVKLGATGFVSTDYSFFVPADRTILAKALSFFGYMMLLEKIERNIEKQRRIIIAEFRREHPFDLSFEMQLQRHKVLFAGYWLERFATPLGSIQSIAQTGQDDLQDFYERHYTPANISIVCVGGVTIPEIIELISESPFLTNKKGARMPLPVFTADFAPLSEKRYVLDLSKHMSSVLLPETISYQSTARIPGAINDEAIQIAQRMLFELLFQEIVERLNWAYSIEVYYNSLSSFYEFVIEFNRLNPEAIDQIERIVDECIEAIGNRTDLFEQKKRRFLAGFRIIDPSGSNVCSLAVNDLAQYQRIIPIAEICSNIEAIAMDDIRNVLKWLQPDQRWTIIMRS